MSHLGGGGGVFGGNAAKLAMKDTFGKTPIPVRTGAAFLL